MKMKIAGEVMMIVAVGEGMMTVATGEGEGMTTVAADEGTTAAATGGMEMTTLGAKTTGGGPPGYTSDGKREVEADQLRVEPRGLGEMLSRDRDPATRLD